MKKLTIASLLVLTTLGVSAFGQAKPGLANNHVTSISTTAAGIRTATRARVIGQDSKPAKPEFKTGEIAAATPSYRNVPELIVPTNRNSSNVRIEPAVTKPNYANSASAINTASAGATQLYRVGIGDVLDIQVSQNRTRQSTLFTVLENGVLDYPLVGVPISVAGLTTAEVADRLRQQIKVFSNPNVFVKVRDYASHSVTINGFVAAPGSKVLRREAVPLYTILSEAMPLPEAETAVIIRKGRPELKVKLSDNSGTATLVVAGDVIKVLSDLAGSNEFFFAGGEFNSPGQKSFHTGLSLTQAILASGGLTRNAGNVVRITRQRADGKLVSLEHNLANIQSGKVADPVLLKGDRIEVKAP
jgi:protein involved in polysaccharide export with SLBB domain